MKSLRLFLPIAFGCLSVALCAESPGVRTTIPNAAQPHLAVGSDGRVWLVYGRSTATPAAAPKQEHASGHGDAGHASAPADVKRHKSHGAAAAAPRMGDVFVACSQDGSTTFAPTVKVAHVPGLALGMRRGPRIAANGDRVTVTVMGNELLAFASTDGDKTWSKPAVIK